MKRVILLIAVVALLTAMLAMPAFAAPNYPGEPNSFAAGPPSQGEYNFGQCQSEFAKAPGPAKIAQDANPAIFTAGRDFGGGITCNKEFES